MPSPSGVPLDRTTRLRRAADVLAAEVDGEMVMMDVEKGVYFGLDAIGTDIWKRLEAPATAAELADTLSRDYDADPATIERDVLALLSSLSEQGLVEAC
ncbi:PqqD family peptide modification chaperone [Azospirillum sp.]|uniref:PqqD family peptide modification chaperone n=1 Tax=Azospirillum sp. TaxID=34012 RepID=UPI003D75FC2C